MLVARGSAGAYLGAHAAPLDAFSSGAYNRVMLDLRHFTHLPELKSNAVYFMGMDKVRFRKPVRPGDQLILKLKILKRRGPVFKMQGNAYVDDQLVAEAELMATVDTGKSGNND